MSVITSDTAIITWLAGSGSIVSVVSLWTLFEALFTFVNPVGTFDAVSSNSEVWEGAIGNTMVVLHKESVHATLTMVGVTVSTVGELAWVTSGGGGIHVECFWTPWEALSEVEVEREFTGEASVRAAFGTGKTVFVAFSTFSSYLASVPSWWAGFSAFVVVQESCAGAFFACSCGFVLNMSWGTT